MDKTLQYYQRRAADLDFETRALIGGRFVDAISGHRLDTLLSLIHI